tara:strand:- start:401 stop:955 length:555 start_codon:yes stop_codon:yes gene_type:complete
MAGEFWNNAAVEPKRTHRFLVEFELSTGVTSQIYARSVTKPGYEVGQSELKFLGQSYYYPGAVSWSDVSVSLVNSANPDFDQLLQNLLSESGYVNPNNVSTSPGSIDDGGTISKEKATSSLGSLIIKELDADGNTIGHYKLNNPWIRSVSYAGLDYGSEELSTVDIAFRYDWAEYAPGDPTAAG